MSKKWETPQDTAGQESPRVSKASTIDVGGHHVVCGTPLAPQREWRVLPPARTRASGTHRKNKPICRANVSCRSEVKYGDPALRKNNRRRKGEMSTVRFLAITLQIQPGAQTLHLCRPPNHTHFNAQRALMCFCYMVAGKIAIRTDRGADSVSNTLVCDH